MKLASGVLASWLLVLPAAAENRVSLELIMSDPLWIASTPRDPYFSSDGKKVYFFQDRANEDGRDQVELDLANQSPKTLDEVAKAQAEVAVRSVSHDRKLIVFGRHGDLFVKDIAKGQERQLTRTAASETKPFFLIGDQRIAFERDGQFFIRDLDTGLELQPVDLQAKADPDAEKPKTDYLGLQQLRLLDVVRESKERRDRAKARLKAEHAADGFRAPRPIYLGDDVEVVSKELAPDASSLLVALQPKTFSEGPKSKMPAFVAEDGAVEIRDVRPKVGTGKLESVRLLLVDLRDQSRHDLDLSVLPGIFDDPLAAIRAENEELAKKNAAPKPVEDAAGAGKAPEKSEEVPPEAPAKKARALELVETRFSPDGAFVALMLRAHDNKDRWIALAGLGEKSLREVHRLSQDGWINWDFNELGWLEKGQQLYFLSEASGNSQLYLYDVASATTKRLTDGRGLVSDVKPSPDGRHLYFTANPNDPGIYETYRVELVGGTTEKVSNLGGVATYSLSLDGTKLLLEHSTALRPIELFVQDVKKGAPARQITQTLSEKFQAIPWVEPSYVRMPSSHQADPIHARFYPPRAPQRLRGADGKVPAVIFIHGAGYLQNAHQGWSNYFREFMFHTWLSENGYAVLDLDYRGSAGYGSAWRQAIYRRMGTPETEDLVDAVAFLAAHHEVDPHRVGLYGGSYGGFMTLMALFTQPGVFAAGAALRPVTDWAHYNHGYTSNILNTPDVDPLAYERSSPIEFAQGLEDPLLMCAPMVDDNVFFQDTVRLAQRLIELEKEDWEVAIYPVEPHTFRRPSSWLDEYRRIFKLFETHLHPKKP